MLPSEREGARPLAEAAAGATAEPRRAVSAARVRPRRSRGPLVYYLLATFDVLTVSASLYLNHRIMQIYVGSVRDNQVWAQRMADYSSLGQLAADVNAPGNDVFDTRDPPRESRRMESALDAFRERLAFLRGELQQNATQEEASPLLEGMLSIERAMGEMTEEARLIFSHFAEGRSTQAGERMATMDRKYARVLSGLRLLGDQVASIQLRHLDRQTAAAATWQRFEYVIAGLILLMVAAATVFGRRISRQAAHDAQERASYIADLQAAGESLRRAHAELEGRVRERTRALQESEAALGRAAAEWQRTFEAIESPVLIVDALGRAVRLNRAACDQAARRGAEPVGLPVAELGEGEPWSSSARVAELVHAGREPATAQARDERSGRTWEVTGNLVTDAEVERGERVIVVARDVTRLVELQESVRREERMSAMGSLVAHVAHEVRNPLFGISSTLDAFEARHGELEPFRKYLPILRREVDRLGTLMRDLLDYGRPLDLNVKPEDFESVIDEVLELCAPSARAAGVRLHKTPAGGSGPLPMDRARVVQVLHNVIENGIQHAGAEGTVAVGRGERIEHGQRWVWCTVHDSGSGFQPADLTRIFEPFFTRRRGGTGLGLSIAQRIVAQHGGTLEAANHPRGGATVTVRLPAERDGGAGRA